MAFGGVDRGDPCAHASMQSPPASQQLASVGARMPDESPEVQVNVPPDKIAGSYANVVSVWHTPHDFAIDFCVNQPYASGPDALAVQVVSRVRIPPTIVLDLLRALSDNLGQYEQELGPVKRPGDESEGEDV